MASLATLPVETLLQIFNQIPTTDRNHCALMCRRLRGIIHSQYGIHCVFQVDHTSHSAWKFIEYLLINPSFGERISRIRVTWHRRQWRDGMTWTQKWYWTADELVKIRRMCDRWSLGSAYYAIRDGLNSEACLPLLLCHTTRLVSLDIGRISDPVVKDRLPQTLKNLNAIYNYCVGNESKREPGWERRCDTEGSFRNTSKMLIQDTPWFYTTFNPEKWLPGLSSLKKVTFGGYDKGRSSDPDTWPYENLKKILLLPRLETLRFSGLGTPKQAFLSDACGEPYEKQASRRGPIRRLEVINCQFGWDHYRVLAAEVGPLEGLRITMPYMLRMGWCDPIRRQGCSNKIANLFLRKETMKSKGKKFLIERQSCKKRDIYGRCYEYEYDSDPDSDDYGYDSGGYDDDRIWYPDEPMQMELHGHKRLENVDFKFAYWGCQEEGLDGKMAIKTRTVKAKKPKAMTKR
ncbi:hypothetical protein TWF569_007440 [Orbilia oligospora]|uniref:F-box domain-containing protein n=1 Tax=Orbilia oligospora TaxID=2813651 RepID=A0A7C8J642_ORBOL|nr:hypothetical protein TWF102_002206 [Orbilia oligospora]KAF3088447.1 hypothetical protein TWF103_001134 [Orbilia oligospora]KAF3092888.1 hypothetical protein TWF706_008880 [Orbilia oligospora]KAF3135629.1 hypothetical protein TWF594_008353 [Orbilia oligospora]KAF3143036.1 hypothetical protein TWF569_007440 [Orbilia oligospora]